MNDHIDFIEGMSSPLLSFVRKVCAFGWDNDFSLNVR
jgi:hypothetical protein